MSPWLPGLLLGLGAAGAAATAQAQDEALPFKLTTGAYHGSQSGWGLDTNLRYSSERVGHAWVGYFRSHGLDASQWRAGWDQSFGQALRVQPSLQLAQGGFVGGSLNLETGERWVVGAGLGRTNLRPYANLNFDPNDAWSLLAAWRAEGGRSLTASWVRDNRQNPDQRHLHLIWREPLADGHRLTLDVLLKKGRVEERLVRRAGLTLTWDAPRWFARLAYDPQTNFTPDNSWRLSAGVRF